LTSLEAVGLEEALQSRASVRELKIENARLGAGRHVRGIARMASFLIKWIAIQTDCLITDWVVRPIGHVILNFVNQ